MPSGGQRFHHAKSCRVVNGSSHIPPSGFRLVNVGVDVYTTPDPAVRKPFQPDPAASSRISPLTWCHLILAFPVLSR